MITDALPTGFAARPATEGDQQAIAELLIAHEHRLHGAVGFTVAAQTEWINTTWQTPGFQLETDSQVISTPDRRIVGYVTVWHEPETPQTMIASPRVHPNCMGLGLGIYLNHWAQQRAQQSAALLPPGEPRVLRSWTAELNQAALELLQREHFVPERYFWQMEIELDEAPPVPTWPTDIEVRTFIRHQDELATYEADYESFATPGEPYQSFDEWCRWGVETKDFDPSLWFLATENNTIIGVCLGQIAEREKDNLGWIEEVAVRPAWRGRGIAQALLYHTFGEYYRRGIRKSALNVDSVNPTGATRVYERVGMHKGPQTIIRLQKVLVDRPS